MGSTRQLDPSELRYIYCGLYKNNDTVAKIIKFLVNVCEYDTATARKLVSIAEKDGLVKVDSADSTTSKYPKKRNENRIICIPKLDEIEGNNQQDWYCYECHRPGTLQACTKCHRTFHAKCKRKIPEKPNGFSPRRARCAVEAFYVEMESSPMQRQRESAVQEISDSPKERENRDVEIDIPMVYKEESKDVICLGEIRPPNRKLNVSNVNCKKEAERLDIPDPSEDNMCSACRCMKKVEFIDPPNMGPDVLSYLIRFVFDELKTWVPSDTFSITSKSTGVPKGLWPVFSKLCFVNPITMEDIDQKIKDCNYKCLTQFFIDVMDVQHNIAIMHGDSFEHGSSLAFVNDVFYYISEIRQCRDCFRHSNEKASKYWFCKPCVPRHELVFAQMQGYSYWPAKVIQFKNQKYDVRFFGGQHERAIVNAKNVKPIESDIGLLKCKQTTSFKQAMEELTMHQQLLLNDPLSYTYDAQKLQVSQSPTLTAAIPVKNRRKPSSPNVAKGTKRKSDATETLVNTRKKVQSAQTQLRPEITASYDSVSIPSSLGRHGRQDKPTRNTAINGGTMSVEGNVSSALDTARIQTSIKGRPRTKANLSKSLDVVEVLRERMSAATREEGHQIALDTLSAEISRWKKKVDELQEEIKVNKKKKWCYSCEEESIYFCCRFASYCSEECQIAHWEEHKMLCLRAKDEKRLKSV